MSDDTKDFNVPAVKPKSIASQPPSVEPEPLPAAPAKKRRQSPPDKKMPADLW